MALRLKTVEYYFPVLGAITNNTLTNFTQITVYLPEATTTFRSVVLEVMADDIITGTGGNITVRNAGLRLGAAAYTTISNTNTLGHSTENLTLAHTYDFTSHFIANWTGTNMTCDAQVQFNQSTGTTTGMRDATAKLTITYEYDDTATTQIKTVWIPLDAPTGALATSKPGAATATIPNLDTFCPEASKTYRQRTIIVQGNDCILSNTDFSISMQLDAAGASVTSNLREGALISDRWFRYTWQPAFTTNATHSFYIWGSLAKGRHFQVWMVVTYEFDATATTTVLNSLLIPMDFEGPADGTTAADFQRAKRTLWVEEPGTITIQQSAIQLYWQQAATLTTIVARVGAGSFTTFTDGPANLCGGNGLQRRCEADLTLVRGLNDLQADVYRTSAVNFPGNMSSLWMLNYTSDKHTDGVGAHNHTVRWNIATMDTLAANKYRITSAVAPTIPELAHYITALAVHYVFLTNAGGNPAGVSVQVERLAPEGGLEWESIYADVCEDDPEVGVRQCFAQARAAFKRNPNDPDTERIDIQTARRYRTFLANNCASFDHLDLLLTYHSMYTTRTGNITRSPGGTIQIRVFRYDNNELIYSTSRVGNGSFSFPWYDDTLEIYAEAYEDGTHYGRSVNSTGADNLDISMSLVAPVVRSHA